MSAKDFLCEGCGKTMPKAWGDEEALAESRDFFGDLPKEELAMVCDDCYRRLMAQFS